MVSGEGSGCVVSFIVAGPSFWREKFSSLRFCCDRSSVGVQ